MKGCNVHTKGESANRKKKTIIVETYFPRITAKNLIFESVSEQYLQQWQNVFVLLLIIDFQCTETGCL